MYNACHLRGNRYVIWNRLYDSIKNALRDTEGLKYAIKEFNKNAKTLERLAEAIEKQNELKERELELLEREVGISRTLKPRNF